MLNLFLLLHIFISAYLNSVSEILAPSLEGGLPFEVKKKLKCQKEKSIER